MPPRGSVTPISSKEPQAATTTPVETQAPTLQEGSANLGIMLPIASESWKRATRVTASTADRMNSASNMMAKWYQKPIIALPPPTLCKMCDMDTARVGAPPVRETTEGSPTSLATCLRASAPWKVLGLPASSQDSHLASMGWPFTLVTPRLPRAALVISSRSLVT